MTEQRHDEPFHINNVKVAAALSTAYGGLCGTTCALASGLSFKDAIFFGGFFGLIVGLMCTALLTMFFQRHHSIVDSLRVLLLPSLICAGVGGLIHAVIGTLLSLTTYVTLASFVTLDQAKSLRFPLGHCQSCGYNLAGLKTARCPECGSTSKISKSNERM